MTTQWLGKYVGQLGAAYARGRFTQPRITQGHGGGIGAQVLGVAGYAATRKRKRPAEAPRVASSKPLDESSQMPFHRRKERPRRRPTYRKKSFKRKGSRKRNQLMTRPFSRMPVGIGVRPQRIVKIKIAWIMSMKPDTTKIETLHHIPDAGSTLNYVKANSLHVPVQYLSQTPTVETTKPVHYTDIFDHYRRARVISSTLVLRNVGTDNDPDASNAPINISINLYSDDLEFVRGLDLGVTPVDRQQLLATSGLVKASGVATMRTSQVYRNSVMCKFVDKRFFQGTASGTKSRVALENADPDALVKFQPWVCAASGTGALTINAIKLQCIATYKVLLAQKVFAYSFG